MSQVTIYVPDALEKELRTAARKARKSLSAYITELAVGKKRAAGKWPRAFISTFGSWEGSLKEPEELELEKRNKL